MSRDALLARGRAAALAGMSDTCLIRRVVSSVVDAFTGAETPTYSTIYSGGCRIKQARAESVNVEVAGDHLLLLRLEVQLPVTVVGLEVRDQVTITASPHDADLVGRTFLVRDLMHMTDGTSRRIQVVERTDS
jgi:hypothetical protein